MRLFVVIAFCCLALGLQANPIVEETPVFISSEHLDVVVNGNSAAFSGRFHFASPPGTLDDNGDVYVEIPIWIPADPSESEQTLKDFYLVFKHGNSRVSG